MKEPTTISVGVKPVKYSEENKVFTKETLTKLQDEMRLCIKVKSSLSRIY